MNCKKARGSSCFLISLTGSSQPKQRSCPGQRFPVSLARCCRAVIVPFSAHMLTMDFQHTINRPHVQQNIDNVIQFMVFTYNIISYQCFDKLNLLPDMIVSVHRKAKRRVKIRCICAIVRYRRYFSSQYIRYLTIADSYIVFFHCIVTIAQMTYRDIIAIVGKMSSDILRVHQLHKYCDPSNRWQWRHQQNIVA